MSRHTSIFLGIFCWMTCVSFLALAVVNAVATPVQSAGIALFVGLAVVTAVVAYLLTRPPRTV